MKKILIIFVFISCGKDENVKPDRQNIIGDWKTFYSKTWFDGGSIKEGTGGNNIYTFSGNGEFNIHNLDGLINDQTGVYIVSEGILSMDGEYEKRKFNISISGSTMTLDQIDVAGTDRSPYHQLKLKKL